MIHTHIYFHICGKHQHRKMLRCIKENLISLEEHTHTHLTLKENSKTSKK